MPVKMPFMFVNPLIGLDAPILEGPKQFPALCRKFEQQRIEPLIERFKLGVRPGIGLVLSLNLGIMSLNLGIMSLMERYGVGDKGFVDLVDALA